MATILGKRAVAQQSHDAPRVPPIRNRFNFFFTAHPWKWEYSPEDKAAGHSGWLPKLGRLNLIPGVGGVGPHGEVDLAIVAAQRRGNVVIMPSDTRLGPYRMYTQTFPTRGKTTVYGSIFDSVSVIGNRASWKFDDAAYREFRRHLITSGIVPDITEDVIEALVDDARSRLEQHRGRLIANPNNPALALRIEAAEERIRLMEGGDPKPAEKPKRTRRTKA